MPCTSCPPLSYETSETIELNPQTLVFPNLIDVNANPHCIELTDTDSINHRVQVTLDIADLSLNMFRWTRPLGSCVPIGYYGNAPSDVSGTPNVSDVDVTNFFRMVYNTWAGFRDLDASGSKLNWNTILNEDNQPVDPNGMNSYFVNTNSNDFVTAYVLYKLYKTADIGTGSNTAPSDLLFPNVLVQGNPLLKDETWAKACGSVLNGCGESANGSRGSGLNYMFKSLIKDKTRFIVSDASYNYFLDPAIYDQTPWAGPTTDSSGQGLWNLNTEDVLQFNTVFHFQHSIKVNSGHCDADDDSSDSDNESNIVTVVKQWEKFTIRFEVKFTSHEHCPSDSASDDCDN